MQPRVIAVDDDSDTLDVLCDILEIKKMSVLARGKNGKEAVELYKEHKPDAVLLDVMMPDYDGFYGLKNIKELDSNANVIMVTADKTVKTKDTIEQLRASATLYKPYDITDLVSLVENVISGKHVESVTM